MSNATANLPAEREPAHLKVTTWRLTFANGQTQESTGTFLDEVIDLARPPVDAEFLHGKFWTKIGRFAIGRAVGSKKGLTGRALEKFAVEYHRQNG